MQAEVLAQPKYICIPNLVLMAHVVYIRGRTHRERERQTHKVTDATDHSTHALATAGVGNDMTDLLKRTMSGFQTFSAGTRMTEMSP